MLHSSDKWGEHSSENRFLYTKIYTILPLNVDRIDGLLNIGNISAKLELSKLSIHELEANTSRADRHWLKVRYDVTTREYVVSSISSTRDEWTSRTR